MNNEPFEKDQEDPCCELTACCGSPPTNSGRKVWKTVLFVLVVLAAVAVAAHALVTRSAETDDPSLSFWPAQAQTGVETTDSSLSGCPFQAQLGAKTATPSSPCCPAQVRSDAETAEAVADVEE